MVKKKMNKTTIALIVMGVLLFGSLIYVGVDMFSNYRAGVFDNGANYGYQLAVSEVARLAGGCQKVPLTYMNQTIEVVDLSCLNVNA